MEPLDILFWVMVAALGAVALDLPWSSNKVVPLKPRKECGCFWCK